MNLTLTWSSSLVASLATHAGVAALVLAMLDARPLADPPTPRSELRIETQEVAHSNAAAAKADAPQASLASAKGAAVAEGPVPQSRATASPPKQDRLTAANAATKATKAAAAPAQRLTAAAAPATTKAAAAPAQRLTAAAAPATTKAAAAPAQRLTAAAAPATTKAADAPAQRLSAAAAPATTKASALPQAAALKPAATTVATTSPQDPATLAAALTPAPDTAAPLPPAPDTATAVAQSAPDAAPVAETTPDLQQAASAPADGEHMVAALAFSGPDAQIDPVSLKAIQSFMQQGDAAARSDETHDALAAILTSAPCSRLQAEFNPETGSLDLRGHVPDPALKAPILAALQARLGGTIKVNDAMLILPRPQCGALSGIAGVGLPQSQDQLTNPRLIGDDAQARAYDYRAGQALVLDLAAPDYDAYVYVDFFAADGQVIHLVPNDTVPLRLRAAKTTMRVGAPDADEAFLNITIGPPYGQEIAAAFAASAPLYDGLRPLSEPAGPYLDWLKTQVAKARAADPDFKGEWVYFFVSTREN